MHKYAFLCKPMQNKVPQSRWSNIPFEAIFSLVETKRLLTSTQLAENMAI